MTPDYNICDLCKAAKCNLNTRLRVTTGYTYDGVESVPDTVFVDLCELCLRNALYDLFLKGNPDFSKRFVDYVRTRSKKC